MYMGCPYIYIHNIGISKHGKHLRLLSSGTKLFITFEFKGSSTQGERYTFFLFWLFHLPLTQRPLVWLRWASESQPSSPEAELNSTNWLFQISQNPPCASGAWRHSHPLVNLSWDFYFDIYERHILPARALTPALKFAPKLPMCWAERFSA